MRLPCWRSRHIDGRFDENDIIRGMRILRFVPVLCLIFLAGCSKPQPAPVNGPKQIALGFPSDDLGRAINLKSPAQRVVCIGPGATETIFALGAGAQLVGRDQVSDYPAAALKVPIVGDYTGPFIEKVIAARPDLVIVQGETYDRARAEIWQSKIGAPVAILAPKDLQKVALGIEKIAVWLGKPAESAKIWKNIGAPTHQATAFFEVERAPLWTAGNGTLIDSVMRSAGLINIARDVQGYKQFNAESLLKKNPYIYVVPVASEPKNKYEEAEMIKQLKSHSLLGKLDCVKNSRVIFVPSNWVLRPGPRLKKGISRLRERMRK